MTGYAPSERRSQAERQAVADKIMAKQGSELRDARLVWQRQSSEMGVPSTRARPKGKR